MCFRLSSIAGDKLMKGNPAIADLGDPNRPMKIAEKYGELYDNEWTEAMDYTDDAMRKLFPAVDHPPFDEILVYHLHRLLMVCLCFEGRRGRNGMVVRFITTCVINVYHH
jgi:hypothetical protein